MEVYKRIVLLITLFGCIHGQSANTEWPVFFEHLGLVHSIHNKWDITLNTNLHVPQLDMRILKTIKRLQMLQKETEKTKSAFRSSEEKSRLEELQESWIKLNRQLSRRAETMRRRTKNLKALGANVSPKRKKRQSSGPDDAVIQLAGGIMQSMFGVAYVQDVKQVVERIDDIDSKLGSRVETVKHTQDELMSRTKETLTKQDRSIHMVEEMAKTVEQKVADMETNPYLKTEIGNIVRSRSELYQNLQLELNLMEERLGEIERVIISLSNARLNKNLFPPLKLRDILQTIENQLPSNFTLLFSSKEPLWAYYSLLTVTATFDANMDSMVVRLGIPLVDLGNVLDLTKVHNLPLKAKDGYSVKVDITAEYLVTDASRNHFLELHKEDFADCQVYHAGTDRHFYCGLPPLLDATTTRSCVMQLYQGRVSSEWCQSKLIYGMVQPFSRLYNGSWVFSALSENVQVTLQCPDGNIPTSLMGFGIVGLAEGCTISNEEFWYPHTFAGAMNLNMNFGDKGWDNSNFHTDIADGDSDSFNGIFDEYLEELENVASKYEPVIILAPEPGERLKEPTFRSIETTTDVEDTTPSSSTSFSPRSSTSSGGSSSTSTSSTSTTSTGTSSSSPPAAAGVTPLFSTVLVPSADPSSNTKVDLDQEDTPVIQALNVQDPENKATEIHNDILIKLREQLRSWLR